MDVFHFHVAHKNSLSHGGTNALDNLIALCPRCNYGMQDRSFAEWNSLYAREQDSSAEKSAFQKTGPVISVSHACKESSSCEDK